MYTSLVVVTGRAVEEPVLRQGKSKVYVKYTIAVPRPFSTMKDTDFFPIVAWDHTAKSLCRLVRKGQLHSVQGVLRENKYTDSFTGRDIKQISIVAEKIMPYERQMFQKKTLEDVEADLRKSPEEVMASLERGLDDMRPSGEEVFGAKSIEDAVADTEVDITDEDCPR